MEFFQEFYEISNSMIARERKRAKDNEKMAAKYKLEVTEMQEGAQKLKQELLSLVQENSKLFEDREELKRKTEVDPLLRTVMRLLNDINTRDNLIASAANNSLDEFKDFLSNPSCWSTTPTFLTSIDSFNGSQRIDTSLSRKSKVATRELARRLMESTSTQTTVQEKPDVNLEGSTVDEDLIQAAGGNAFRKTNESKSKKRLLWNRLHTTFLLLSDSSQRIAEAHRYYIRSSLDPFVFDRIPSKESNDDDVLWAVSAINTRLQEVRNMLSARQTDKYDSAERIRCYIRSIEEDDGEQRMRVYFTNDGDLLTSMKQDAEREESERKTWEEEMTEILTTHRQQKLRDIKDPHKQENIMELRKTKESLRAEHKRFSELLMETNRERDLLQSELEELRQRLANKNGIAREDKDANEVTEYNQNVGVQTDDGLLKTYIDNLNLSPRPREDGSGGKRFRNAVQRVTSVARLARTSPRMRYNVKNKRLAGILEKLKRTGTPKTILWLLKLINNISRSKIQDDLIDNHSTTLTMPEYVFSHLKQIYGTDALVDEYCGALFATMTKHTSDPRCSTFSKFLTEEWSSNLLMHYLKLLKAFDDLRVGPEYNAYRQNDDQAKLVMVSRVRCTRVIEMHFDKENLPNGQLQKIFREVEGKYLAAEETEYERALVAAGVRTNKGNVSSAPTPNELWGVSEQHAREYISRAEFLETVCQVLHSYLSEKEEKANEENSSNSASIESRPELVISLGGSTLPDANQKR